MADKGGAGIHERSVRGLDFIPEGGARDVDAKAEGEYGGD